MDDHQLAARAADGDQEAFELIVRRHTDAVWRLARTLLDTDGDAEEAVQDAFLRAHRSLDGFRGDASLSTWLLVICRHTCLDRRRRRQATVVPLEAVRERHADEVDHSLRLSLRSAVAELGDVEREAFTLVDVLGYSREEAARIAEVPPSTMRSRSARARQRLMAALEDTLPDTAARSCS